MATLDTLTDVLGRERMVARTYGDGSVDCPFCTYAIRVPSLTCANPWCVAHPEMPVVRAQEIVDAAAREAETGLRRIRDAHAVRERIAEERKAVAEARLADLEEAKRRGACMECMHYSHRTGGRKKFIRHRDRCPRAPRSRYDEV